MVGAAHDRRAGSIRLTHSCAISAQFNKEENANPFNVKRNPPHQIGLLHCRREPDPRRPGGLFEGSQGIEQVGFKSPNYASSVERDQGLGPATPEGFKTPPKGLI